MDTLSEKMTAIFNSGHSVIFQNRVKRIEGEWEDKITWTHVQLPGNNVIKSCKWEGFDTIDEAVEDCLNYMVILGL